MIGSIHGHYQEIIPGLCQGSVPTRNQSQYYEPFDHVVICTDPEYAYLWTYRPDDDCREVEVAEFDYSRAGLTKLLAQAESAANAIRSGQKVIVVCASGVYRSSLFVSLVRMYLGTPLDDVLADVVASHSGWSAGSAQIFAHTIREHLKGSV